MISDNEAFVWVWLLGETRPVVAGRVFSRGERLLFNYGRSYLERMRDTSKPMPLYLPELPLTAGIIEPRNNLLMPGCLRDGAPDAWGRRVILNRMIGAKGRETDTTALDELTYWLMSGSDRPGALDFQRSAKVYEPRLQNNPTLIELLESVERLEQGQVLSPILDQALFHASSIGGARPKALLQQDDKKFVAKFSSGSDVFPVVKAEFVAMRLAAFAGLEVAPVQLVKVAGKDVLLVERFDRIRQPEGWSRRLMVSALTLFELDEMWARYASYETFADLIRQRFDSPRDTLKELFGRLVFNVLCGNTDDHARNHAAFWDGEQLSLTPAYDICPQPRSGNEASQAMRIIGENNRANLLVCLQAASSFLLSEEKARRIIQQQIITINERWQTICEEAELTDAEANLLWQRSFLNPSVSADQFM